MQTRLVTYFTGRIERTTGVKIQIGGVDFRPVKSLVLTDVLLTDHRSDTLLYCKKFRADVDTFRWADRSFSVKNVLLDKAYFNLWIVRGKEKSVMNLDVFLDSLQGRKSGQTLSTSSAPSKWWVGLKQIQIRNSRFVYKENRYEPVDYGINWTDVECREVNADITEPDFGGDNVRFRVSDLNFIEKSGFTLRELDGVMVAGDSTLSVTEGKIRTDLSCMNLKQLRFDWIPGHGDWRNFTTRMRQNYILDSSFVSFIDLAYFNEKLRGIENTVQCSGIVYNTVNRIEGRNLEIRLGEKSMLKGRFKSYGLPDFWNTIFDIDFEETYLSPEDLETIYLPWLQSYIHIPAPLHHYERFAVKGKFKGRVEDFVLQLESTTPGFRGNIDFAYTPCTMDNPDCSFMSGKYRFPSVHFGKLGGLSFLGYGSISGNYKGHLQQGHADLHTTAGIHNLNVYKGKVKDMDLFLTWEDDHLNLISSIDNSGVRAGLALNYDMNDSVSFLSSKGHLSVDSLARFGISLADEREDIRLLYDLVYAGKAEGGSFAHLELSGLTYTNSRDSFALDIVSAENRVEDGYYTTSLLSDVVDMQIEGQYTSVRPVEFSRQLLMGYLPAYTPHHKRKSQMRRKEKINFRYSVDVKDMNRVLRVLYPGVDVAPGTKIYADYADRSGEIRLSVFSDSLRYEDVHFVNPKVEVKGDASQLEVVATAGEVNYNGWSRIYNVRNGLTLRENTIDNRLQWCNWERETYSGDLSAAVKLLPLPESKFRAEIAIHPGIIIMADSVWRVGRSVVEIEGKGVKVSNFRLQGGNQFLSVNGKVSEDPSDSLAICLNRFDLTELNRIVFNNRLKIFGVAEGNVIIQDYYGDNLLYSDVQIRNWGVNKDTLGTLKLRSFWDADSSRMMIRAENQVKNEIPLRIGGYYAPSSDSLDIHIGLSAVGMERLGRYADSYFVRSAGEVWGDIRIAGTSADPQLTGHLYLDSVLLRIRDLNTDFLIHDSVYLEKNRIIFDRFTITDAEGNHSWCSGYYSLAEDRYDLNITSDNFLLMDTRYEDNEVLYGKIFMSGYTNLNNQNGILNVGVTARPENNSELFLPLTSAFSEDDGSFLHFVNQNLPQRRRNRAQSGKRNLVLNANLELNDKLKVQIVFDPTIGDVLKTSGSGDIKIGLDQDGAVNMFGEYKITKGSYLFTLGGVFNKSFQLKQGGGITWNGSPYNATIDISAVYNLKTSLNELLSSTNSLTDRSTKVPVECILGLSDNITNPLVKFDINFPSLDSQTKSFIQSLFSSQDEINKQMFSLLMLNKFYKPDYLSGAEIEERNVGYQAGVTTASEMVSNQLSRWLSKISTNFDIDFSYRPGDNITADEIELALSTQLLNDRVTISANGNMDVGNTKNVNENSTSNNIAGDFDIDVKLNKQGTLKLKAYSHTDEKIIYKNNTETIQGVGVSYQETFDTFKELLQRYFGFLGKNRKKEK